MTHFLAPPNRTSATLALLVLLLSSGSLLAQCAGRCFQPRHPGALELGGSALLSTVDDGPLLVHPGFDLTLLGRSPGLIHRGVRIGMGILGTSESGVDADNGTVDRHRALLPEVAGVVRLSPFRQGFQPFLEGELGAAATLGDVRTFDEEGDRIAHRIPEFDPTLHYGWAAGTRIRMAPGTFLAVRYAERFGGLLDAPFLSEATAATNALDGRRRAVSLALSLSL